MNLKENVDGKVIEMMDVINKIVVALNLVTDIVEGLRSDVEDLRKEVEQLKQQKNG